MQSKFLVWQIQNIFSYVITRRWSGFCALKLLWMDLLSAVRVEGLQLSKHLYLRHSCLTVAVYVFNDLQSHSSSITGNTKYKYLISNEGKTKKRIWKTQGNKEYFPIYTYLVWSMHSTTFPKAPSPRVHTISSTENRELKLETQHWHAATLPFGWFTAWCYIARFSYTTITTGFWTLAYNSMLNILHWQAISNQKN